MTKSTLNPTIMDNGVYKIPSAAANDQQSGSSKPPKFLSSNMTDTTQKSVGSRLPLVIGRKGEKDEKDDGYNPFELREVAHPTSDFETLVHLLKGSLGSGILAMPLAFMNAGLWFGLGATLVVGTICTYGVHVLVKCAHILCHRRKIPMMSFADVAEQAFLDGTPAMNRWSRFLRFMVNTFLVIDLLGCCCIYLVFVASNVKQVVDFLADTPINIRLWIVIVTIPLIFMSLIRNLKYLVPFSMIANVLLFVGIIITFTYMFRDVPPVDSREGVASIEQWPLFLGTVIFALEGIGVVMSLENDMKNPQHFIGCPSVLNIGMGVVIALYATVGFFGYLKYGSETKGSVTLNLPVEERLAQSVKLMIAVAIFFTFTLQFYVPVKIIWQGIQHKFAPEKHRIAEYALRMSLVILCGCIAVALPNLGPFISLIGAVCLSTLGLIIPAVIELAVYRFDPGYGCLNWRLFKDAFLITFGVAAFFFGTYISILEFKAEFQAE